MVRSDLGSSTILLIFGLAVAFESWRMPRYESRGGTLLNAPGLVPGMLGLIIALLGTVMLVRYIVGNRNAKNAMATEQTAATDQVAVAAAEDPRPEEDLPTDATAGVTRGSEAAPSNRRLLVTLLFSVVFAAGLIGRMPFWLAVFLFVFASIVYHERSSAKGTGPIVRLIVIAGVIAGATGFAVPFVFEKVFLVNLP